jgi:hypothetical protein
MPSGPGCCLGGNAEAAEDCARGVGAVEGVEVDSGNVVIGRFAQLLHRSLGALATLSRRLASTETRLSTFFDVHPSVAAEFDAS